MNMDDSIVVSSIIEKLPPSWKVFKKSLKHKKEDLTLEELAIHLQLEEETRRQESKDEIGAHVSKVHVVEDKGNGKGKNSYNKKRNNKNQPKSDSKKKKGACCCSKPGHFKSECRSFNNKKIGASESKNKFVAVISEVNILEDANDWWIYSGATRHVCNDKNFFNTYESVDDRTVLYMGNSSTATIKGKGTVDLEFTSGKIVSLTNVCHVPEVRKNLPSGRWLNKHGFRLVFESDKFILSKGGNFCWERIFVSRNV